MQSLRYNLLLLSMFITGGILLGGCGESTCADSCGSSDGCPDVSGSHTVYMQVLYDECNFGWYDTSTSVTVSQSPSDDMTRLTVNLGLVAFSTMEGELCNTSDSTFPKKYGFGASGALYDDDFNIDEYIGGDFVFFEGGNIDICGSFKTSLGVDDEICNSSASIYSSTDTCD